MTVQAEALRLHVRQFATFDHTFADRQFGTVAPWKPIIIVAVGSAIPGLVPQGRERKTVATLTP